MATQSLKNGQSRPWKFQMAGDLFLVIAGDLFLVIVPESSVRLIFLLKNLRGYHSLTQTLDESIIAKFLKIELF